MTNDSTFICHGVCRPGDSDEECVEELVSRWRQENIDDNIIINVGLVKQVFHYIMNNG